MMEHYHGKKTYNVSTLRVRTSSFDLFPCQTLGGTLTSETKKDAKFVGRRSKITEDNGFSQKRRPCWDFKK